MLGPHGPKKVPWQLCPELWGDGLQGSIWCLTSNLFLNSKKPNKSLLKIGFILHSKIYNTQGNVDLTSLCVHIVNSSVFSSSGGDTQPLLHDLMCVD